MDRFKFDVESNFISNSFDTDLLLISLKLYVHNMWLIRFTIKTAMRANYTGSYCLEPWERKLFNTTMVTVLLMTVWTAYIFLPGWLTSSMSMFCAGKEKLMEHASELTRRLAETLQ